MPLYTSPDGIDDPRPRCTGHCCRGFSLEYPLARVQEEYRKWQADPSTATLIPNIETIHEMLVPLGVFQKQELFTCKHLGKNGDCQIYEKRPQMCRDFPGPNPCRYRNCASHGPQSSLKRFWNWLRD